MCIAWKETIVIILSDSPFKKGAMPNPYCTIDRRGEGVQKSFTRTDPLRLLVSIFLLSLKK